MVYPVDEVGKHLVPEQLEEGLKDLILVVKVVHLDDESVDLLDLVHHVQVLLRFDGVHDPLGLLAELWELQVRGRRARLCPTHNKVDRLCLTQLAVRAAWNRGPGYVALRS